MYDSSGIRTFRMLAHHMVLPVIVLSIQQVGSFIRQMRASMLEVLQARREFFEIHRLVQSSEQNDDVAVSPDRGKRGIHGMRIGRLRVVDV